MDWTAETLYMICAVVGGTILVVQLILLLFGIGDHDFDVDAGVDADVHFDGHAGDTDHDHSFGLFSVRAVTGFLTLFGLVGLWGTNEEWGSLQTPLYSMLAGTCTWILIAWLLSLQKKLYSAGNVEKKNAIGLPAQVYLRIPGAMQGKGKITVKIQNRTAEYDAVTSGPELPTGAAVRVVRMTTEDTFEVEPLA